MILVKDCFILPMTGSGEFIDKGFILIDGPRIAAVGSGEAPAGDFEKVIDGQGMAVMPGFVNAHTHAAMTLMRGYADDIPLMNWLQEEIWPLEDKITPEDIYHGTMLAIVEMIKSGTTCFADMYFHVDQVAKAVEETGIRACLARGMIGVGPESEQAIGQSRELVEQWNGAGGGRIVMMLGPHAPYTCPPDYLKRVIGLSEKLGVGLHIHIAETRTEFDDIKKQYGMTPVALMEDTGVFSRPVLAAHCVHLTDEDISVIARCGVGVAHNPESNMKLGSGIAPVPEMLEAGITVGLGTDGAASNNDLDMMQELRSCALLHKVSHLDPTVLPAYQVLEMATASGARALGLTDVGMLKPDFRADLIMLDFNKPHLLPRHNMISHLVYSAKAGDVDTVMVDGRVLMEKGRLTFIDEERVLRETSAAVRNLLSR